jgi:hypothetical protein
MSLPKGAIELLSVRFCNLLDMKEMGVRSILRASMVCKRRAEDIPDGDLFLFETTSYGGS